MCGQTGASFNRAHYTGAYCAMLAIGRRTTPEALGKQVPPMGLDPPNLDQQSVAPRRARSWLVVFRGLGHGRAIVILARVRARMSAQNQAKSQFDAQYKGSGISSSISVCRP